MALLLPVSSVATPFILPDVMAYLNRSPRVRFRALLVRAVLWSSLMVLLLPAIWGATYYVSPTGNDSAAGTEAQPWLTIYRATRKFPWYIQPGDTLMVRGGVYSGNANAIDIGSGLGYSGTSDKPITIKAYPGETPIVTGMTSPYAAVLLKSKSYWILDGITYSNCYSFLFFQDVTHFVITNCVFTTMPAADSRYTGISLMGASQYNIFTHNTVAKWGPSRGPAAPVGPMFSMAARWSSGTRRMTAKPITT